MSTVLVVDDKEMMRDSVGATLQRSGFAVVCAADGGAAIELLARRRPDVVVTDMRMPGMDGLELVARLVELDDDLPVIVMTAHGTIETAVRAIKLGAFDYLTKPFEGDQLIIAVKRAAEHGRMRRENAVLRLSHAADAGNAALAPGLCGGCRIIGQSPAARELKSQIEAIAGSQGTVLVTGESGSGKEVVSRALHELSPRAAGPFLAVNCAALSESLLESELFGHEKGAFTGADKLRKGRFELADGGTLLLDEVSEVPPQLQAKLLRVLQERSFERVGSSRSIGVDVRVIATSNRDLPRTVAAGGFRQDLYYRLNVLPIRVPALRERVQDVPLLAEHFIAEIARREGRPALRLSLGAQHLLSAYGWPGNVRELQNVCERAVVLWRSEREMEIPESLIEPWLRPTPTMPEAREPERAAGVLEAKPAPPAGADARRLEEIEREAILRALNRFAGHRQKTARALGIGVRTLGLKLKKWKQMGLVELTV